MRARWFGRSVRFGRVRDHEIHLEARVSVVSYPRRHDQEAGATEEQPELPAIGSEGVGMH
jgi:hypothetical protein